MPDSASPPASTASSAAPSRHWFWINAVALCILAPWATYWFQQHLKLYFTGIVIVGGVFSVWALAQAMWGLLARLGKVDALDHTRRLLSRPDVTAVLFAVAAMLLVLWFSTASLYVTYEGAANEGEYLVEVVRQPDNSPVIAPATLTAGHAVVGGPFLWQGGKSEMLCRILRPAKYEVRPCNLEPGRSTRIRVPGSFTAREFHLLRLVPGGTLYSQMPSVVETPVNRFDLEVETGGQRLVLEDMRRQVLYTGAGANEMPVVMALEEPGLLQEYIRNQLLARDMPAQNADRTTAILTLSPRTWPTFYVREGDRLSFTARLIKRNGEIRVLEGFPVQYTVTADKVQTIWLPE